MKPYFQDDCCTIYHADCREVLPTLGRVDLVMTDPPYGIGECRDKVMSRGNIALPKDYGNFDWDCEAISQDIIDAAVYAGLFACIFGGNYYAMPPSSCWLVWDKDNGKNDFADAELAWTNFPCAVRLLRHMWNGMLRVGSESRFHPTQKPLAVIKWAISLAPESDIVLDPFMGSGTTLRACKDLGKRCIGIDKEERYCEIAAKRLAQGVLAFGS